MNKFNDLKLYRGATSVIELDFTGFDFAENSKCQLTIEKKYNNHVIYQHDFDKPIKYYITFKDEFTANLDDDKYKYDIMYMLNDERYPQCEISDIYMEEVINNYNGEVNPDAVEVTEVLTDGVEVNDAIKINNSNIVIINSKLQEISIIPTKEEQVILPQENYNGISKVIVEKISDEYIIPTGIKEITSNGVHNVAEFESANINVNPNLEEGRATPTKEEQVITPNEDYDGFSKLTVDPIPNEYIIPNGALDIKTNGTHDVTEKSSVNVDVQPSLQDKKVTVKPTDNIYVMPDEDYYGLSYVNVIGAVDTETKEVTPTKEVQTINRSEDKYIESVKVNAIPDEYIIPSGELEITENGNYDVTDKASVKVETSGADLSEYFNTNPTKNESMENWVYGNLVKKVPDIYIPDDVTDLSMFCVNVSSFPIPIVHCNDNITNMYAMYRYAYGGDIIDVSNLNTNNVTNMSGMFNLSTSKNISIIGLNKFNTEKVTNMSSMFYGCGNTTSFDLSSFNTNNVNTMSGMFSGCSKLIELDLSKFDTSNVTNMSEMFRQCSGLTSLDLSSFDTSNVTSMSAMFRQCSGLTSLDLSSFDTSNVTSMSYMFYMCKLTSIDLSNFNTNSLNNTSTMFSNCLNLTHIDIRNFDFTNVTSYTNMFGVSSTQGVPDNCLIIVKDETAKTWITDKFSRLTNVKTVAEYEAQ